ncbi:MAG: hypothetical protein AAF561_06850 [Planctomycetota bacterium]
MPLRLTAIVILMLASTWTSLAEEPAPSTQRIARVLPIETPGRPASLPRSVVEEQEAFQVPERGVFISPELMAQIKDAAIIAQAAKLSGLPWDDHYLRFMKVRREAATWNQVEYDAMGMLFGAYQTFHSDTIAAALEDAEVQKWVEAEFHRRVRRLKKELGEADKVDS